MRISLGQEIKKVEIDKEGYPKRLKEITDAPRVLYYRGTLKPEENCFAIVGTRRASDYGKEIASYFARELTRAGLTIVSGMALGIDTFSHKGALEFPEGSPRGAGRTIAVLGTGLAEKSIYPQENLGLAKKILEQGGCLLSEYPPEYPGSKFTFPQRNRLIAGLSLGVFVVEAKFGSGALITAKRAKKQGKPIFAAPGPIHSRNSQGPHWLIKQGAILVEKPTDILKQLKLQALPINQKRDNFLRPACLGYAEGIAGRSQEIVPNGKERIILDALGQGNLHIDKIIAKTKLSPQEISAILSIMEIEEKVKNLGGNIFALINF